MNQKFNKKIFFYCLPVILLLATACSKNLPSAAPSQNSYNYSTPITVGSKKILVEVAGTPAALALGLSERPPLTDEQGMLFVFLANGLKRSGFWMKNMKFDLDFIWIYHSRIVGITKNIPAPVNDKGSASARSDLSPSRDGLKINDSNLPLYYPPSDVSEVLEVNSGWSDKYKINVGDEIIQHLP